MPLDRPPTKARTEIVDIKSFPLFAAPGGARAETTAKRKQEDCRGDDHSSASSRGGSSFSGLVFVAAFASWGLREELREGFERARRFCERKLRERRARAGKRREEGSSTSRLRALRKSVEALERENRNLQVEVESARRLRDKFEAEWQVRESEWRERESKYADCIPAPRLASLQEDLARLRTEAIATNAPHIEESLKHRKNAFEKPRSKRNAPPGTTSPLRDRLVKIESPGSSSPAKSLDFSTSESK